MPLSLVSRKGRTMLSSGWLGRGGEGGGGSGREVDWGVRRRYDERWDTECGEFGTLLMLEGEGILW
jgi:hypothetical protein